MSNTEIIEKPLLVLKFDLDDIEGQNLEVLKYCTQNLNVTEYRHFEGKVPGFEAMILLLNEYNEGKLHYRIVRYDTDGILENEAIPPNELVVTVDYRKL